MDELQFTNTYANNLNLSIFTFNIQSLPAKFVEFSELIRCLQLVNAEPDIICLQEIWQFPDHSLFQLPGYADLIFKQRRNNVQGGGVAIYVKSSIKFSPLPQLSVFVDRVFESIFIEITPPNSSKIIVGSAYRPGTKHPNLSSADQFSQFIDLLSNLCSELSSVNCPVYLAGDINLDVLQYNFNHNTSEYIDLLFSFGFFANCN
jgi:exonuclease III